MEALAQSVDLMGQPTEVERAAAAMREEGSQSHTFRPAATSPIRPPPGMEDARSSDGLRAANAFGHRGIPTVPHG
jgi:hypothetical protein